PSHLLHLPSFPTRRSSDLNNSFQSYGGVFHVASHCESGVNPILPPAMPARFAPPEISATLASRRSKRPNKMHRNRLLEFWIVALDRKSTRLNSSHRTISYA